MVDKARRDHIGGATRALRILLWASISISFIVVPASVWFLFYRGHISLLLMCMTISTSWSIALALITGHYVGFWKAFMRRPVGAAFVTQPPYTYAHRFKDPPLRERELLLMYQRGHPFNEKWIFPSAVVSRDDRDARHTAARVVQETTGVPAAAEEELKSYSSLGSQDSAFAFRVHIFATVLEDSPETVQEGKRWVNISHVINSPDTTKLDIAPRFVGILRELVDDDERERRRSRGG